MPIDIIEYDDAGRILQVGTSRPENIQLDVAAGKRILVGAADPLTQYVRDGAVAPRPLAGAVLDGMTLRQLPAPCQLILDGTPYPCPDEVCELSFAHPGRHQIVVDAFPMQTAVFEVTT
ncbi:hypothetical protein KIF53_15295 [Chromobacterium subtsugae]|uniref:Uncharacterized protein n=1 Tax=Chromobacterium subtsugae TaxID=251747 RepID=A0ABS7FG28_9NEIS|nr:MULTISPECIES: hypothetical protein [Chromobacterium]KUM02788.1 hypothetical protein Cv017_01685 [Chromobacterium subtsugae]KZE85004.1 hypothetical protein AWB61_03230 [Chromobacterium sp. F49]MBW7567771.1 hypothetical protein [Chromobacterium subtsugae]MBW8288997.1 hypothetical protein [Chromobacterium subtsugae]OBU85496.1 hypothetical protein MY55_16110 [Chromobacterium subtsugae]